MELLLLVGSLVLMILVGAPIGVTMAVLPMVYIAVTGDLPLSTVPYQVYQALAHAPLVAIPFFLLTGELMNSGQITERLLALSRELVGRFRGGLAQVTIMVSMLFAGMNGSVVADTAAVGSVLIPPMKKAGYSAAFAAAITAVAGTIGGIIPPSIAMIPLASGLGLSVGGLFAGGILPGVMIGLMLIPVTYVIATRRGYERLEEPFSVRKLWLAFRGAMLPLTIPIVIVGAWCSACSHRVWNVACGLAIRTQLRLERDDRGLRRISVLVWHQRDGERPRKLLGTGRIAEQGSDGDHADCRPAHHAGCVAQRQGGSRRSPQEARSGVALT